jgi:hypothetical protein
MAAKLFRHPRTFQERRAAAGLEKDVCANGIRIKVRRKVNSLPSEYSDIRKGGR